MKKVYRIGIYRLPNLNPQHKVEAKIFENISKANKFRKQINNNTTVHAISKR